MSKPPIPDIESIQHYCNAFVPEHVRDQVRMEVTHSGSSVTFIERQPPWRPEDDTDWTKRPVGQLRWDSSTLLWSVYWPDSNTRWHRWESIAPADVTTILAALDSDETKQSGFWG